MYLLLLVFVISLGRCIFLSSIPFLVAEGLPCQVALPVSILLILYMCKALYPPLFLKDIFTGDRLLERVFIFPYFKYFLPLFLTCIVSDKKFVFVPLSLFLCLQPFPRHSCFKDFLFTSSLSIWCTVSWYSFPFYLFTYYFILCVGVYVWSFWASSSVSSKFSLNLKIFKHSSRYFFLASPTPYPTSLFPLCMFHPLAVVPQLTCVLFICWILFSLWVLFRSLLLLCFEIH